MQRRIVEPADVSGAALAELKSWLGITRPNEDELLTGLLQTSLAMCESFTGQTPLMQLVEERLSISPGQCSIASRPVSSVSKVELEDQIGGRVELTSDQVETEVQSSGSLAVDILKGLEGRAVVVSARVGIGDSWDNIPAPLRQGIIRLCAYHYRDRDRPGDDSKMSSPPVSVSALWRPWQTQRLI